MVLLEQGEGEKEGGGKEGGVGGGGGEGMSSGVLNRYKWLSSGMIMRKDAKGRIRARGGGEFH